ncbi:MAG: GntR family transcriptional regulator [Synergistaceae bacterium]|nr:GntR family transcriptional regulator [Synergistaceae bacterium]
MKEIDRNNKMTLSDIAYSYIKRAILSLEFKPGSLLVEEELSELLSISRTPIRTALQKLSHEGLVIFGSKSTRVKELSPKSFLEIFDLREALEHLAIRDATIKRKPEDLVKLRALYEEQKWLLNKDKIAGRSFLDIDSEFHFTIAESSYNSLLVKYMTDINQSFIRYLYYTDFQYRTTNVINEHGLILEAIEKQDIETAQKIMEEHLKGVKDSIMIALIQNMSEPLI